MPYCVNCGVELSPGTVRCPLCRTPVVQPNGDGPEPSPFFPTRRAEVPPVSKKALAALLSAMLASLSACCALLNLVLRPGYGWSLFVVGAAAMLWVWFVLPLLVRRAPLWLRLILDMAAVGVYVYLIALTTGGEWWFFPLAVPVLAVATGVVLVLWALLRRGHSVLTTVTLLLLAAGVLCVGVEFCCDRFLLGRWSPGWSVVVLVCCVGLCIPLVVVRRVASLREEVRRRFHF